MQETVVLKLNGGLGTSMGLDKAKSLLPVKGNDTFLDLTAKQVTEERGRSRGELESLRGRQKLARDGRSSHCSVGSSTPCRGAAVASAPIPH